MASAALRDDGPKLVGAAPILTGRRNARGVPQLAFIVRAGGGGARGGERGVREEAGGAGRRGGVDRQAAAARAVRAEASRPPSGEAHAGATTHRRARLGRTAPTRLEPTGGAGAHAAAAPSRRVCRARVCRAGGCAREARLHRIDARRATRRAAAALRGGLCRYRCVSGPAVGCRSLAR